MALIYAFRDEAGQSHGDPDATLDGSPATGTLSVPPTADVAFRFGTGTDMASNPQPSEYKQ